MSCTPAFLHQRRDRQLRSIRAPHRPPHLPRRLRQPAQRAGARRLQRLRHGRAAKSTRPARRPTAHPARPSFRTHRQACPPPCAPRPACALSLASASPTAPSAMSARPSAAARATSTSPPPAPSSTRSPARCNRTCRATTTRKLPTGPAFSFPAVGNAASLAGPPPLGTGVFYSAVDIHWHDPYSLQTNLSIDQDLGHGFGLRASYIGLSPPGIWSGSRSSTSSPTTSRPSPRCQPRSAFPFPNFGAIYNRATSANANYQSGQVELHHRTRSTATASTPRTPSPRISPTTRAPTAQPPALGPELCR